eukprot:TRINITY_DN1618_c0_g2_i1.p1 TRINITY_DN1618_c0_g2~~TRINITY_DN1618_c0_g2_i1.p1  ORF type:complete len:686 (+),score=117.10 TRINITY_DN1618_c0_g2_i1:2-2059(+)
MKRGFIPSPAFVKSHERKLQVREGKAYCWRHARVMNEEGKQKWVCLHCGVHQALQGGTTAINRHSGKAHRLCDLTHFDPESPIDSISDLFAAAPSKSKHAAVTDLFAHTPSLPLSLIEAPSFRSFVTYLDKSFPLYSRQTLKRDLEARLTDIIAERNAERDDFPERQIITQGDLWGSRAGVPYLNIAESEIIKDENGKWVKVTRTVDLVHMPGTHSAEQIREAFDDHRIYHGATTDNGSNMIAAFTKFPSVERLHCCAHNAALVVHDVLNSLKPKREKGTLTPDQEAYYRSNQVLQNFLKDMQALVNNFTLSKQTSALKQIQEDDKRDKIAALKAELRDGIEAETLSDEDEKRMMEELSHLARRKSMAIKKTIDNRWNAVHDTCSRLVDLEPFLKVWIARNNTNYKLDGTLKQPAPTFLRVGRYFWARLPKMVKLLAPFGEFTRRVCVTKDVSLPGTVDLIKGMYALYNDEDGVLFETEFKDDEDVLGQEMFRGMMLAFSRSFAKRFCVHSINPILVKGHLLDPNNLRNLSTVSLNEAEFDSARIELQIEVSSYPDELAAKLEEQRLVNVPSTNSSRSSLFTLSGSVPSAQNVYQDAPERDGELDAYLNVRVAGLVDPLQWWTDNEHRFPFLAHAARKYLAWNPSSVLPESTFSIAGLLQNGPRGASAPGLVRTRTMLALDHYHS